MTPIEMLTLVSTINQLAEQSKDGIKPFSKAKEISFFESAKLNEDDINTCISIKSICDDEEWEILIHDGMWYHLLLP